MRLQCLLTLAATSRLHCFLQDITIYLGMASVFLMVFLEHTGSQLRFLGPIAIITLLTWAINPDSGPTPSAYSPPSSIQGAFINMTSEHLSKEFIDFRTLVTGTIGPALALYVICLFDIAGIMYRYTPLTVCPQLFALNY